MELFCDEFKWNNRAEGIWNISKVVFLHIYVSMVYMSCIFKQPCKYKLKKIRWLQPWSSFPCCEVWFLLLLLLLFFKSRASFSQVGVSLQLQGLGYTVIFRCSQLQAATKKKKSINGKRKLLQRRALNFSSGYYNKAVWSVNGL